MNISDLVGTFTASYLVDKSIVTEVVDIWLNTDKLQGRSSTQKGSISDIESYTKDENMIALKSKSLIGGVKYILLFTKEVSPNTSKDIFTGIIVSEDFKNRDNSCSTYILKRR